MPTHAELAQADLASELVHLYPVAVREVYGFLTARCGSPELAEDLTAEAFAAAARAISDGTVDAISTGWLVVVARRRLVDHWRRQEREQRHLEVMAGEAARLDDPWDMVLDASRVHSVLANLRPRYRAALTLRYVDGLPVAEVASYLALGLHATEGVLQRARAALRVAYDACDEAEARADEEGRADGD